MNFDWQVKGKLWAACVFCTMVPSTEQLLISHVNSCGKCWLIYAIYAIQWLITSLLSWSVDVRQHQNNYWYTHPHTVCSLYMSKSLKHLQDVRTHQVQKLWTASLTCLAQPGVRPHPSASCSWPHSLPTRFPAVSWWRAASRRSPSRAHLHPLPSLPQPRSAAPPTWTPSRQPSSSSQKKPFCR